MPPSPGPPRMMLTKTAGHSAANLHTLNGAGTPNGNAGYAYFRYSTTNPGIGSDAFGTPGRGAT